VNLEVASVFLALDTATDGPSLALGSPASPGPDLRIPTRRDLSRDIEREAARLLAGPGVGVGDLAGVVVADGPGSFTGLRIGIAFAKGLCRAAGIPLLVAPSLMAAALAASAGAAPVLVEYDALRGDVYRAAYRFLDAVEVLAAPALVRADSPVHLAPPFRRAGASHASAASLLKLVGMPGGATAIGDPAAWEPFYGRPAEAEARYRARQAATPGA
jgi:tRNA threonylcarbamoyl adenosine modification protein YeaZ